MVVNYLVKQGIEAKRLSIGTVENEAEVSGNGLVGVRFAVKMK